MRFFQTIGNFIFEFNSIPQFIAFTIGRIFGVALFILIIIGWYLLLHLMGYIESIEPFLNLMHALFW